MSEGKPSWCKCDQCAEVHNPDGEKCCQDYANLKQLSGEGKCIRTHESFSPDFLNEGNLLKVAADYGGVQGPDNTKLRHLAYRHFAGKHFGKKEYDANDRIALPWCVKSAIEKAFSSTIRT